MTVLKFVGKNILKKREEKIKELKNLVKRSYEISKNENGNLHAFLSPLAIDIQDKCAELNFLEKMQMEFPV